MTFDSPRASRDQKPVPPAEKCSVSDESARSMVRHCRSSCGVKKPCSVYTLIAGSPGANAMSSLWMQEGALASPAATEAAPTNSMESSDGSPSSTVRSARMRTASQRSVPSWSNISTTGMRQLWPWRRPYPKPPPTTMGVAACRSGRLPSKTLNVWPFAPRFDAATLEALFLSCEHSTSLATPCKTSSERPCATDWGHTHTARALRAEVHLAPADAARGSSRHRYRWVLLMCLLLRAGPASEERARHRQKKRRRHLRARCSTFACFCIKLFLKRSLSKESFDSLLSASIFLPFVLFASLRCDEGHARRTRGGGGWSVDRGVERFFPSYRCSAPAHHGAHTLTLLMY